MNSRKVFYILGFIGIFLLSFGSILFVRKSVVGFDVLGFTNRDCVPFNVFVSKGPIDHTVSVLWSTKGRCVGFIQYGIDRYDLDMVGVDLENKSKSKSHSVVLDGISSKEVYYFLINSEEQAYGNSGVPLEFTLKNL